MKLREIFTEKEINDILKQEHILNAPNYDVINWNLERHYMDLTIEQYFELRKIDLLFKIKENIEGINLNTEDWNDNFG